MSKKNKHKQQQQQQKKSDTDLSGVPLRQVKSIPGLMSCIFSHRTTNSTVEFDWVGQPLNDIWPTVLAFLKWTYDTYKSESQLRLFVNKNTGEWAPWAFPQKANTGMTAKEIDQGEEGYDRTIQQRAQFSDTEGWYYWGTVHHHCSGGAFQSGTDTANERNQDGIHITVGHLDKNQYDIHFRIYVGGFRLKDITPLTFWDIGDELLAVPEKFRQLLPANIEEMLAKQQMGIPAPQGTEFPQEWRDNIIDVRPKSIVVSHPVHTSGTTVIGGQGNVFYGRTYTDKSKPATEWDKKRGAASVLAYLRVMENVTGASITTLETAIGTLKAIDDGMDGDAMDLFALCVECDILPGDLCNYLEEQLAIAELRAEMKNAKKQLENEGGPSRGHEPPTVHNAGKPTVQDYNHGDHYHLY